MAQGGAICYRLRIRNSKENLIMRVSKSRSRNKGNRNRSTMGNVINRVFDSSGPEGKVRGTPQQIIDKYNQLARDAQLGGDRVATENFQQHAEHYLRLLSAAHKEQEARREEHERLSRERHSEREMERNKRQDHGINPDGVAGSNVPDIADTNNGSENSIQTQDAGLVDTPESQSAKQRRNRRHRKENSSTTEESRIERREIETAAE